MERSLIRDRVLDVSPVTVRKVQRLMAQKVAQTP
jgi:hypothetical protein